MKDPELKKVVSEKYAQAAVAAKSGKSSCCAPSCCGGAELGAVDPITRDLYGDREKAELPKDAVSASLGCGNPTALTKFRAGDVVLDLGSGGGIDVLLSARRVGPTGKAYGLDMTDEMLALARENQKKSGLSNVEFLKGEIEEIPLPDNSVDVIISNCVINLSADKDKVFREAFRVLKSGGRFAVSDVVLRGEVPPDVRKSVELWIGCLAGALEESEYLSKLEKAGFSDVSLEVTRVYEVDDAREMLDQAGIDVDRVASQVDGKFISAFGTSDKAAMMAITMKKASTDAIWTQFSNRLRGFIAKRVRDESDVQDILQDTFAKIHAGLGGVRESEKLEAWLFQVARRAMVDHFRSRSGKRRTGELPEDLVAKSYVAGVAAEVASWLDPMMDLIPDPDREALRLTDLEGVSQKELAARLGISVTGAKSRVQRARKRLKDVLLECCQIEMDRRGNAIGYRRKRGICDDCSCS